VDPVRGKTHQFRWAVDGNAALDTNSLAKLTADAFFLVDSGDLEEFGVVGTGLHGDTVEGANVHAEFAGGTGFGVDFGFRNGQRLDLLDRLAFRIDDGLDRAVDTANSAVDAERGVDMERGFLNAGNGFGRAFHFAKCAADAGAKDGVWHVEPFMFVAGNY